MDPKDSKWQCQKCKAEGTLTKLINDTENKHIQQTKLYNPRKEKNIIKYELRCAIEKSNDPKLKKKLEATYNRIDVLLAKLLTEEM